jgi:PPOX class probable FMN-dependent enzyme
VSASDPHAIETLAELRSVIPEPTTGIELKIYDTLIAEAVAFIARSPFLVMATSDDAGNVDASPKGDEPGFVTVVDDTTLLVPDRPGNKLAYGLTNILTNPHIGVIFMIPGTTETLRVNGRAELRRDPELLDALAARGRPALLAIRVTVEQCFFHCSKAFLRSQLWKPDTWPERQRISFGAMVARRLESDDPGLVESVDAMIAEDYRTNL